MARIFKYIFTLFCTLFLGLLYSWSVFVAPLEAEFGWQRDDTSLTFTISIIFMCSAILLGGQFNKHKDKPVITLCIASGLLFIGFFAVSRAESLMAFFVFYGAICGFGCGFGYTQLISIPGRWFPKRRGLTQGMLMMCIGLGAMILGTVISALMATCGWRSIFVGLSILFPVVLILEGIVLQSDVNKERKLNGDINKVTSKVVATDDSNEDNYSLNTKQMIKSGDFKCLYLWMVLLISAGLALTSHIAPCAMSIGASTAAAALMTGTVSISNGIGRIFYGTLYDFLGVKKTMLIGASVFLIATVVTLFAILSESVSILVVGCVLIGMSFGLGPISGSTVVNVFYGPKYFSSNFGVMGTPLFFGALIGPLVAGKLYIATGAYTSTFYMMVGFGVLAFIVINAVLKIAKKNDRKLVR